jgi:hypothetical protein
MEIRKVKVSSLKPAAYNPRRDLQPGDPEYDTLKKQILEFGLVKPLVWNEKTKRLVGGHQRLKILTEIGWDEVKVSVVNLNAAKEKALNVALNNPAGEWDFPKLKDLIADIDTGDFDIGITGFQQDEIDKMFGFADIDAGGSGGEPGVTATGNPLIKIEVPGGVWFDSQEKLISELTDFCNKYGLSLEYPQPPKKQKKQRF